MKYAVIHNGTSIVAVQEHSEGSAIATLHNVLVDTYENLLMVLTTLNIDAQPLHTAKEDYERHQAQLNQN